MSPAVRAAYEEGLRDAATTARQEAEAAVSPTTKRALRALAHKLERKADGRPPLALVSGG